MFPRFPVKDSFLIVYNKTEDTGNQKKHPVKRDVSNFLFQIRMNIPSPHLRVLSALNGSCGTAMNAGQTLCALFFDPLWFAVNHNGTDGAD